LRDLAQKRVARRIARDVPAGDEQAVDVARPHSMKLLKPSGSPVLKAIQRGMSTPPNSQAVLMQ